MARNYQREEGDWRRQQPSWQEDDQWDGRQSDDDYSMGLGQESRGARGEDYSRRGNTESGDRWARRENMRRPQSQAMSFGEENRGQRPGGPFPGRERDYGRDYGRGYDGGYRGEGGWTGDEGWQSTSPWQRSQGRGGNQSYEGIGGIGARARNEGQFVGRGPRSYKRSDERIEEDINERLTQHGTIDATDVEVSVQNAEVTLRGSVDSRQAKRLAEDIADAVSGVKEVVNQIKVKSGESKHEAESGGKQRKAS